MIASNLARLHPIDRWRLASYLLPILVLCSCLTASWAIREQVLKNIEQAMQAEFDLRVQETAGIFKERLHACEQVLHASAGWFSTSKSLKERDFRSFIAHLDVRRIPGLLGVGFVEAVEEEKATLGRRSRISYFEPPDYRLAKPGSDPFSEPSRRPAMLAARELNMVAISDKRKLPEEKAHDIQAGYRMYLPVYRNGADVGSVSARRGRQVGWVYAAFSMDDLIHNILGKINDIVFEVYDGEDMADEALQFDTAHDRVGGESDLKLIRRAVSVEVGGYTWTVSAQALPNLSTSLAVENLQLVTATSVAASLFITLLTWLALRRKVSTLHMREQQRETERKEMLSQERLRLTQDMHDGMGASLISALRVVEHGQLDMAEVAQVLRSCIDDLKLAIDSMEPVEQDLLLLLATLRFRIAPRLEATGIVLRWEIKDVPPLHWLTPRHSLHILRILQETFTNVIKHAQATTIRVATSVEDAGVVVTLSDDGHGFNVEEAMKSGGKGLTNQKRRAEAIGGKIDWSSDKDGTRVSLWLPC